MFFFCKQKTAYVLRISDWSSDVCSSDLSGVGMYPIGVSVAAALFCVLSKIHFNTRVFSRYPGHMKAPLLFFLNQLTWKIFGSLLSSLFLPTFKIGRASCRERVYQYV